VTVWESRIPSFEKGVRTDRRIQFIAKAISLAETGRAKAFSKTFAGVSAAKLVFDVTPYGLLTHNAPVGSIDIESVESVFLSRRRGRGRQGTPVHSL